MMRNMLLAMDPPRHVDYRRPIAPRFKARVIASMEDQIRAICREIMAAAAEQGDVEFVHDVTSTLPSRVIGQLMGLPAEDLPLIHRLAEMNTSGQDADYAVRRVAGHDRHGDVRDPVRGRAAAPRSRRAKTSRRCCSRPTSTARYMTDIDFGSFFVQLVTAGQRHHEDDAVVGPARAARASRPARRAARRSARSSPARSRRSCATRTRCTTSGARRPPTPSCAASTIAAGDKVVMFYTSANRDEDVFDDPQRFDIRRSPNPHLSFGIAEHFCLGVHLARLEGRVFFEELLATFPTIELTGEPVRIRSNLNNALKSLPVRLAR